MLLDNKCICSFYFNYKDSLFILDGPREPSLVLIVKWGGELTPAGRIQAEELGRVFRCMYPGGQGRHYTGQSVQHIIFSCCLLYLCIICSFHFCSIVL